ncbi:MAG: hypothetical protein ACLFPQ_02105 [Candidatus Woesearchaeota archaeon]
MDKQLVERMKNKLFHERVLESLLYPKADIDFGPFSRPLYPCCGSDPVLAESMHNVKHIDVNKKAISDLVDKFVGLDYWVGDISEYEPERPHDLIVIKSPGVQFDDPELYGVLVKSLADKGCVLTDDKHRTAHYLMEDDCFRLIGRYSFGENGWTLEEDIEKIMSEYTPGKFVFSGLSDRYMLEKE